MRRDSVSKIAEIRTYPISVRLEKTLWTAHEELRDSNLILVEVRTDDGIKGYGYIHGSPQKGICEWVARLAEVCRGLEGAASVAVWEEVFYLKSHGHGVRGGHDG